MTELEALAKAEEYVSAIEAKAKDYKGNPEKINPDEHLNRVLKVAGWLRNEGDR